MKPSPLPALLAVLAALAVGLPAAAQSGAAIAPPASPAAAAAPATEGVVRKVDVAQGKLTLRHGRIENLDMDAMTMVFRVAESHLLDGLKPGDKVRFAAASVNGALTVTAIEPAR
jgi:Cu(I)/Ag(I) efflux system protein CusF